MGADDIQRPQKTEGQRLCVAALMAVQSKSSVPQRRYSQSVAMHGAK